MGKRTQRRRDMEREKLLLIAAVIGIITKLIELLMAIISRLTR